MNLLTILKPRIFHFAVIICLICFLILLITKCYVSLSYIPDISGSENSSIFPIQSLRAGAPIYTDPESAPFRFTQYTPLYFEISAQLLKVTGWSATEVHKVFVLSRFLSISFTLAASFIIFFIVNDISKKGKTAGILTAAFVFQVLGYWFLTSSRPDSLLALLTTLYLVSVYKAVLTNNDENWWWVLAILISVTAFFVKQSGVIHSITLAFYCLNQKKWKLLLKLIILGIIFFLAFLFLLPLGNLKLFFSNIIGGVANTISWRWFYDWTFEKLLLSFAPLLIMNMLICYYYLTRETSPIKVFLSIASASFFLFATATGFKVGSGVGYYQDFLIISSIQIAIFLKDSADSQMLRAPILKGMLASYLIVVSIHCTAFIYMTYNNQPLGTYKWKYMEQHKVANYLINEKKLSDKDWIYVSEEEDFDGYFIKHFLFRNALIPFPDIIYLANKSETYDFREFKQMVDEKQIRYVIAKKGSTPRNILGYEFDGLFKSASVESYDIYEF